MLRAARAEGLPVTVETCPHYLHFAAEDIADGDARYKCAPPIRGRDEPRSAVAALDDGDIDLMASDHSPCPPEMKAAPGGDFAAAWGGIASIQLTLPVVWSGARSRGIAIERLARWLCARPAELLGLEHDRGAIVPDRLANLVAWDPEASFVVDPARLLFRHPQTTPYAGQRLHGTVERTWLRGREVARDGTATGAPTGEVVIGGAARRARRSMRTGARRARSRARSRAAAPRAWLVATLPGVRPRTRERGTRLTRRSTRGLSKSSSRGLARGVRPAPAHRRPRKPAAAALPWTARSLEAGEQAGAGEAS